MKVSSDQTSIHDKKDFIAKFYVEKRQNLGFNALLVDCLKKHYRTKLKNAIRLYFIIEGQGTFTIDGVKESAKQYDFFMIAGDQTYEYEGKMKLIEVNIPATDKSNEEKI